MVIASGHLSYRLIGCYRPAIQFLSIHCKKIDEKMKINYLFSVNTWAAGSTIDMRNYLNRRKIITQQRSISYDERRRQRRDPKKRKEKLLFLMNSAISGAQKSGQWQKAVQWFDSLEGRGLQANAITFRMVICACENANEHAKQGR